MEHILFLKLALWGALFALIVAVILISIAVKYLVNCKRTATKREKACEIKAFSFQVIERLGNASGFLK